MKLAFLYTGQGSQKVGMGQDFYHEYSDIRKFYDKNIDGIDIKEVSFAGPLEMLSQTMYTQVCMGAFAASVTYLLYDSGIKPDYAAGLSLGEYSALHAAGVLDADTLLELLAFRGRVMQKTTENMYTRMVAVLGLDEETVISAVNGIDSSLTGVVTCANFNCPGQVVIGGDEQLVLLAERRCQDLGAKRCLPLNVSGPFHTPLMEEASNLLKEKFITTKFFPMDFPVVFNTTGEMIQDNDTIEKMLVKQVKSPTLFAKTIKTLAKLGVDTIIEIGPGKVLAGFVKKTCPEIKVYSIEDVESFKKVIEEVKK